MVTMSIGTKPAVIVRHIIVTLKWPRKILDRIAKPKEILAKLTGNLDFPLPYPSNVVSLSQLASDIDDVDKAQVDVKNGVIGAVQDRNVKLGIVKADLQSIKTMIQIKANSDPENAESMVKGTGFNYVYGNHGQKQQNGVKRTNVSGVYLLLAEGGGEHEWQLSPDKINIIYVQPTSTAHTLSPLLTLKQTYYLRSRKIGTKGVMFDWTPWFEFIVT
jgi:hypothetical protein